MRGRASSILIAAIAGISSIPATYALLRGYAVLFGPPEANPATIITSLRIAMFWRLGVGAYVGGMIAIGAYVAANVDPARTVKVLHVCVLATCALLTAQALLLP